MSGDVVAVASDAPTEAAPALMPKASAWASALEVDVRLRPAPACTSTALPIDASSACVTVAVAMFAEPETMPRYGASEDPLPRRRVLRQMLKKLFKKGKIGASHTHEDNVYRGVVDHEKGIAKEAMDLLYREGLLVPKPTATDPHVSLRPDRTAEIQAIIAGEIQNPRLLRWARAE